MEITYSKVGDYYLPNLILQSEKKDFFIGKYGRMRKRYLEQYRRGLFINLLTSLKLNEHLQEIDIQCNDMVEQVVKDLAKQNGVDEKLKASDQMKWVGLMNAFKAQAEEVVIYEVIFIQLRSRMHLHAGAFL